MENKLFPKSLQEMKEFTMIREFRDPLYGYIHVNKFESEIIETEEFQRLDRIFQMPTARFVYPNGTYTRKSHSLGVMHLASKALLHILYYQCRDFHEICPLFFEPVVIKEKNDTPCDSLEQQMQDWWSGKSYPEIMECERLAALLHDVGHAPFTHLFEDICTELKEQNKDDQFKFNHEEMSRKIIAERLIDKFKEPIKEDDIVQILLPSDKSKAPTFLHELIDGPYDCDKLDYLLRDSYHIGAKEYGSIDYERIIDGFRVKGLKLLVSKSAIGSLINSFNAIQSMYTNVYYHKTSRIFDFMISDALLLVPNFIKEIISDVNEFIKYDDFNIITEIKHKRTEAPKSVDNFEKAYEILKNVMDRKMSYRQLYSHNLTLAVLRDRKDDLTKLKEELEEMAKGFKIIIDFRAKIRPVGIRIESLRDWLTHDIIFDEDDPVHPTKNLEDISRAYFELLKRYQILFYIFVQRDVPKKLSYKVNKIKECAERKLKEIEMQEEKLL